MNDDSNRQFDELVIINFVFCINPNRSKHVRNSIAACILLTLVTNLTSCVQLIPPTPDPRVRYIAFGDSTTDGPSERNYPDILREKLGLPTETFTNQGKSGETTEEGLQRMTNEQLFATFPNAEFFLYWEGGNDISDFIKNHDPLLLLSPRDDVFPFTGTLTDVLDTAETNIELAIRNVQDAGLDVLITTYYPVAPEPIECGALLFDIILPQQAVRAQEYLDLLNARIRRAASTNGATLVDVAAIGIILQADINNYFDCNHLTIKGNDLVANLFFNVIMGN